MKLKEMYVLCKVLTIWASLCKPNDIDIQKFAVISKGPHGEMNQNISFKKIT
jgi:hypothetical protein